MTSNDRAFAARRVSGARMIRRHGLSRAAFTSSSCSSASTFPLWTATSVVATTAQEKQYNNYRRPPPHYRTAPPRPPPARFSPGRRTNRPRVPTLARRIAPSWKRRPPPHPHSGFESVSARKSPSSSRLLGRKTTKKKKPFIFSSIRFARGPQKGAGPPIERSTAFC